MPGWRQSGGVKRSHAVVRRDGSSSPSVSRISTPEPDSPRASFGFPRHARITKGAQLQAIAQEGKRIRTVYLEVRGNASPLARPVGMQTRVGLIVPRFRHSAVARNRVKRRLRELSRTRLIPMDIGADVVIRIRPETYKASFPELASDFDRALVELKRWHVSVVGQAAPESPISPSTTDT